MCSSIVMCLDCLLGIREFCMFSILLSMAFRSVYLALWCSDQCGKVHCGQLSMEY